MAQLVAIKASEDSFSSLSFIQVISSLLDLFCFGARWYISGGPKDIFLWRSQFLQFDTEKSLFSISFLMSSVQYRFL